MSEHAEGSLTVERAIDLLGVLRDAERPLGIRELARRLEVSPTATHRLLVSLRSRGFVEQDPVDRRYWLGWTVVSVAEALLRRNPPAELGAPLARHLRDVSRETVIISMPIGAEHVCVFEAEGPQQIRRRVVVGTRAPLVAGASGRVILAFSSPAVVDRLLAGPVLKRYSSNTPTDPADVRRKLEETRTTGIARSQAETVPGVASIATPFFGSDGSIAGSLAVSGPIDRAKIFDHPDLERELLAAGTELSHLLGFVGSHNWSSKGEGRRGSRVARQT
jgi:IclR family transcriptional regulator, KDG regulon repressor